MSFNIFTTSEFERQAKNLAKRYKSFKSDLKDFVVALEENPFQGVELHPGIRKIRMKISSKGKGKSGGARIITYTILTAEREGRVYLLNVYDKSDFSTIELSVIKEIVNCLK
ncbi:MAG: addiction module toxin RelE [Muribaculaceae bacterium]|nr:addiction module toxin RelE [Muribaculaceae bacterium]